MAVDMEGYVNTTKPRWFVVMRADQMGEKIGTTAQQLVNSWSIKYDTFWAMNDLNKGAQQDNGKYNCGEFVGKVLETVTWNDIVTDDTDALPGTYLTVPKLHPVYMDRYTGEKSNAPQV